LGSGTITVTQPVQVIVTGAGVEVKSSDSVKGDVTVMQPVRLRCRVLLLWSAGFGFGEHITQPVQVTVPGVVVVEGRVRFLFKNCNSFAAGTGYGAGCFKNERCFFEKDMIERNLKLTMNKL